MFKDVFVQLLQSKSITAYKLSQDTGIPQSALSHYKAGTKLPSAENLCILSEYFNCSIDYLLGRTDVPEVNRKVVHTPYYDEDIASAPYIAADDGGITEGRQLPLSLIKKINEEN